MPTKTIEIQQKKTHLNELITLVRKGTEIILTQGNIPIARLVPIADVPMGTRVADLHNGAMQMSDNFDEPLPDEFWLGQK